MNKLKLFSIGLLSLITLANISRSELSLSLEDLNIADGKQSVSVEPGQSFSLSAFLNIQSENILGLSYYLYLTGINNTAELTIISRDIETSEFIELTVDNSVLVGTTIPYFPLDSLDLGGLIDNFNNPVTNEKAFLSDLSFNVGINTPPGQYLLKVSNESIAVDSDFNSLSLNNSAPESIYAINVVPEANVTAILGFGIIGVLFFRWRNFFNTKTPKS